MRQRMERRDDGFGRPAPVAALAALALAGCGGSAGDRALADATAAIRSGGAQAAIQRHFDTHRQCAPVLGASAGGRLKAAADDPVAAALAGAGLIVATDAPGVWRPAPAAARWFEPSAAMPADVARLCYARRKVSRVLLDVKNHTVRYTYRLTDFAPWTRDPALRRAVPALAAVSTGMELPGEEGLPVTDGRVRTEQLRETALDPTLFEFGMDFTRGGRIADDQDS